MSTTSNSNRILRSASKPRSDAGAAGPSVAARSTRGRGSRRGASPAVAADAPEDDKPELIPASNRAYGTMGKPGNVHLQSAQMGMQQAMDPILEAVSGAEASHNQFHGDPAGLYPVDEEVENSVTGSRAFYDGSRTGMSDITPGPGRFSRQYWGPRQPHANTRNEGINLRQEEDTDRVPAVVTSGINWTRYSSQALKIFGAIAAIIGAVFLYSYFTKPGYLPGASVNGTLSSVSVSDYNVLKRRLGHLQQHVQDLSLQIPSADHNLQQQINWFTPGFAPTIDLELSSPTATFCDPTWKPWPLARKPRCPELSLSPPHKMALQTWDDPMFDRWCAPRSGGKLQLTVEIERDIRPTELVVEYMAKEASPTGYMDSAPKEIELWIRVPDDDIRAKVSDAIGQLYPHLWEESSPQGRELHLARDLDDDYIPVGRWIYNVYRGNHIQTFKIPSPLLDYGVDTSKVAVRVNSNWGNVDYTCINRLRLHGVDTSGIVDDLEEDVV